MKTVLVSIMKDELDSIHEWISYHKSIGFDMIRIYDNGSTDGQYQVLTRMANDSIIELVDWSDENFIRLHGPDPQTSAYTHAINTISSEWICFLDADEFLNLHLDQDVNSFVNRFDDSIGAVGINWRIFGSSSHNLQSAGLVIDRFQNASEISCELNRHIKTIGRISSARSVGSHMLVLLNGRYVCPNGLNIEIEDWGKSSIINFDVAQINHYCIKSKEEFQKKRTRGNVTLWTNSNNEHTKMTESFFILHDRNECLDTTIMKRRDKLLAYMNLIGHYFL